MILVLFSSSFLIIPKGFFKGFSPPLFSVLNIELVLFLRYIRKDSMMSFQCGNTELNPILLYEYLVFFSPMLW